MKKNKGFTLVELLSIMTILGVMVLLVVPQIGGSIYSKKEKELEKLEGIIENAGKAYHSFNEDEYKISVDNLISGKFLSQKLINPITGEELNGCVRVVKDKDDMYQYNYSQCETINVPLTVVLGEGAYSPQEFQTTYPDSTKIDLINPTKTDSDFNGWKIVKGNSILDGKTLIIGTTETIVYALWKSQPTLTINPNGGTTTQSLVETYPSGTTITLTNPTRTGYKFIGWSITIGEGLLSGSNFTIGSIDTTVTANWETANMVTSYSCANGVVGSSDIYSFVYTGDCEVIDEGDDNWRVKFLTSGILTPSTDLLIDAFLVGGGGGGATSTGSRYGGGGGGGGYTTTTFTKLVADSSYSITIGSGGAANTNGENTTAFNSIAFGGYAGLSGRTGGSGGSGGGGGGRNDGSAGGPGGTDGGNGTVPSWGESGASAIGQEITTREFGESDGTLYSGGGGGGGGKNDGGDASGGAGGSGGGATGGKCAVGSSASANTGGGGGGGSCNYGGGTGGSGIVVIRNTRSSNISHMPTVAFNISYTGSYAITNVDSENWKIKFLTSGTFTSSRDLYIDAFLVGGGGGGANSSGSRLGGGGGGGGYTTTTFTKVIANKNYVITVGEGGGANSGGSNTTAFNSIAFGGYAGTSARTGGSGGSGGGGGGRNDGSGGSAGGSNGANGAVPYWNGEAGASGIGQSLITREFGESTGTLYSGGGGGGGGANSGGIASGGAGGAGGGAIGGRSTPGTNATPNTGGGGGGGSNGAAGGSGGSGTVVIRNTSSSTVSHMPTVAFDITYTGSYSIINDGSGSWRIKFLTSGTFTPSANLSIDAFLVGGGSGGSSSTQSRVGGGGGGGGYTKTGSASLLKGTSYTITVGSGGGANTSGTDTSAFGLSAAGGSISSSVTRTGGSGGSGGGGGGDASGSGGSAGGSDGSSSSGSGQGTTTREFGLSTGALYAGGGGGGGGANDGGIASGGAGGSGGGATGGRTSPGASAVPGTGGGGGGGSSGTGGGSGGSGIVVIKNK